MRQHRACAVVLRLALALCFVSVFKADADAFVRDWLRFRDDVGPCSESGEAVVANELGEFFVAVHASCGLPWTKMLLKYSADGELLWKRPFGFWSHPSSGKSHLVLLENGDVLVVKSSRRESTSAPWQYFLYFARYDANGQLLWSTETLHSDFHLGIYHVALLQNDNIAVSISEDPPDTDDRRSLIVFDEFANYLWDYVPSPDGFEHQYGLGCAAGDMNYLFCLVKSTSEVEYSDRFLWLAKLDISGNLVWTYQISQCYGLTPNPQDISIDPTNNFVDIWTSTDFDQAADYAIIHRVDFNGNVVWNNSISPENSPLFGIYTYGVAYSENGDIIAAYHLSQDYPDFEPRVVKFDKETGNIIWDIPWTDSVGPVRGRYFSEPYFIHKSAPNVFMLTGVNNVIVPNAPNDAKIVHTRISSDGEYIDYAISPSADDSYEYELANVIPLHDGGFASTGTRSKYRYSGSWGSVYQSDSFTAFSDSAGDPIWSAVWSQPRLGTESSVVAGLANPFNGVDIGSTTDTDDGLFDMMLTHRDETGVNTWTARYQGSGWSEDRLHQFIRDLDGNAYLIGTSTQPDGFSVVIAKYSSLGEFIWDRKFTFDDESLENAYARQAAFDSAGNLIIFGYSYYGGSPSIYETWGLKLDPSGQWIWQIASIDHTAESDVFMHFVIDDENNIYVWSRDSGGSTLRRVSTDGQVAWAEEITTSFSGGTDYYLMGYSNQTILFVGLTESLTDHPFDNNVFISKFSLDGALMSESILYFMPSSYKYSYYISAENYQIVQDSHGHFILPINYTRFTYPIYASGILLMKLGFDANIIAATKIPGTGVFAWGHAYSGSTPLSVDRLDRTYWAVALGSANYIITVTSEGLIYSLVPFEDPTENPTLAASVSPGDLAEFYVTGSVESTARDTEQRIVSARYVNPCGTTTCPWLGSCVDVGDTMPGNSCSVCEMQGGFAQFLPLANGSDCGGDGRYCNGVEECNGGLCLPTGNPCTYPQLCMERDAECIDPIPIGQAMPDDAVPTTLAPKTSVTPDVNEMMLREWINHATAEAEGEAFDPAWDDTDWSLLDLDAEPATSATSASVHRETNDEDVGGCGM